MAEAAVERFDFQSPDAAGEWTEEFHPWCRRSPGTGSVMLIASKEVEAALDKMDEERWDASFAKSHKALARLAAQAERDDRAGRADTLDPDLL